MSDVVLLRHGLTAWNSARRIQGQRDIGLSREGRAQLGRLCLPPCFRDFDHYASPLSRAVQTAELLGMTGLRLDARLMELDWGEWVGCTREQLRARDAQALARNEARGWDFRPPGGESPRELAARLSSWLGHVAALGRPVVAVTHKGVIQMALALATGYDLVSRPPYRLEWRCAQHFVSDAAGTRLRLERVNVGLARRDDGARAAEG